MLSARTAHLIGAAILCLGLLAFLGAGGGAAIEEFDDADNESQQTHENPNEVDGDGDPERIAEWLESRLSARLVESQIALEEGDYERARALLGDEYDERLEQYSDVVGQTDREENTAEEFERARTNQTEMVDTVDRYDETYDEYQEAREAGDQERARELARELETLSGQLEETGINLDESYRTIEAQTGAELDDGRTSAEGTTERIRESHETVRETEFVETELVIERSNPEISFLDPMTITGTLSTADGQPIANEDIRLLVGEQELETTTDPSGGFEVTYRPTTSPIDVTRLEIEYVPERQSEHLGSVEEVPVAIEQVEPTVEVTSVTEQARFGEEVVIEGSVHAEGTPAGSIPLMVTVGGEELDRVETDDDGTFAFTEPLPANVPAGEVGVRAEMPHDDRALGSAEATASIHVEETAGELTMEAERSGSTVEMTGRLTTVDGAAVPDGTVWILVAGQTVGSVETDGSGHYQAAVELPEEVRSENGTVTVAAVYEDGGSNVGDAEATATIDAGEGAGSSILGVIGIQTVPEPIRWVAVFGPLALLGGIAYLMVTRRDRFSGGSDRFHRDDASGSASSTAETSGRDLLEMARTFLDAGDVDRTVEVAYTAVRRGATDHNVPGWTHWEFYRACQANGFAEDDLETLRTLTERFERAAFSAKGSTAEDASQAVSEASEIVTAYDGGSEP